MRTLRTALLYFAIVFGAGFVLGPIRVTWLVPLWGERAAELAEMPVMLAVIFLGARFIARRAGATATRLSLLRAGLLALALMLAAEFSMVLWLRHLTLAQYFAQRDPVAGSAYAVALLAFAVMPAALRRARDSEGVGAGARAGTPLRSTPDSRP